MAFSRPSVLPVWATGGTIVTPSGPKQALGWVAEKPPLGFFNWFQNLAYQWLGYLDERTSKVYADTAAMTAATNLPDGGLGVLYGVGHYVFRLGDTTPADGEAVVTHADGRWILEGLEPGNLEAYAGADETQFLALLNDERIDDVRRRLLTGAYAIETSATITTLSSTTYQVSVPGARVGDAAWASGFSAFGVGLTLMAYVEGPDVVAVRVGNPSAGNIGTGVGTLTVGVIGKET